MQGILLMQEVTPLLEISTFMPLLHHERGITLGQEKPHHWEWHNIFSKNLKELGVLILSLIIFSTSTFLRNSWLLTYTCIINFFPSSVSPSTYTLLSRRRYFLDIHLYFHLRPYHIMSILTEHATWRQPCQEAFQYNGVSFLLKTSTLIPLMDHEESIHIESRT